MDKHFSKDEMHELYFEGEHEPEVIATRLEAGGVVDTLVFRIGNRFFKGTLFLSQEWGYVFEPTLLKEVERVEVVTYEWREV